MTETPRVASVLHDDLAQAQADLAHLEAQAQHVREHIARLEADRETARRTPLPLVDSPTATLAMTPANKVALFRSLFRGRDDVFPRHWTNAKTGRNGYAPACANEWVRGVCDKPRVKCGECQNRKFISVDDQTIIDHLRGRYVVGVYPLLADETCWFLAADFDGDAWREDMRALYDSCRSLGISVSLERSRSGHGAHAWFFFAEPVSAKRARQFGCFLLTEAMRRRSQMRMHSYDRLFPNQDTMPTGGLGNLIALPLQGEARRHDNTVFLSDALEPLSDQWAYLHTVERLDRARVETLATEAARTGRVIAVRASWESTDEQPKLARQAYPVTEADVPIPGVLAVLAQQLFVTTKGLPTAVRRDIKNIAAFQNPEFYKRQRLRLYTGETPRVIECSEERSEHIVVPRGCLDEVTTVLREYGTILHLEDDREHGRLPDTCADMVFRGTLRPEQVTARDALSS